MQICRKKTLVHGWFHIYNKRQVNDIGPRLSTNAVILTQPAFGANPILGMTQLVEHCVPTDKINKNIYWAMQWHSHSDVEICILWMRILIRIITSLLFDDTHSPFQGSDVSACEAEVFLTKCSYQHQKWHKYVSVKFSWPQPLSHTLPHNTIRSN